MKKEIERIKGMLKELESPRCDLYDKGLAFRAYAMCENAIESVDLDASYMPVSLVNDVDELLSLREQAKKVLVSLL